MEDFQYNDSDYDFSDYGIEDSDYDKEDSEEMENNIDYERLKNRFMASYPENKIWIKHIFKWLELNNKENKKFFIIWDEDQPLKCVFMILKNSCDNIGSFSLTVSEEEPYFPYSPPILNWIEPNLNFIDSFSIKYIECFRKEYWNICQNLDEVLEKIYTYVSKTKKEDNSYSETLINHLYIISEISGIYPSTISSDLPKFGTFYENKDAESKESKGIGYSQGDIEKWDVDIWETKKKDTANVILNIYEFISNNVLTECDINNIKFSALIPYLNRLIQNTSLQELNKNPDKYIVIYKIGSWLYKNIGLLDLHNSLITLSKEIEYISSKIKEATKDSVLTNHEEEILFLVKDYNIKRDTDQKKLEEDLDNYIKTMSPLQCNIIEEIEHHVFKDKDFVPINIGNWCRRLFTEWKDFNKSLPLHRDGSVFIRWYGDAGYSQLFKILIIPPLSTPYGGGCYEFDMFIPPDYPNRHPSMKFLTTGSGTVRFNPNLYNCGKICLSLLGTWSGEKWNPKISNIYQICVSILALIFVDEPYFNEPGYQNSQGTERGIKESEKYNDNIKIQNIKYGIIGMIKNPPKDFQDVIINHYKLRMEDIKDNILKWIIESKNPKPLENLLKQVEELRI